MRWFAIPCTHGTSATTVTVEVQARSYATAVSACRQKGYTPAHGGYGFFYTVLA